MPKRTGKEPDDVKNLRDAARTIIRETYRLDEQGVENVLFFCLATAKRDAYTYALALLSDKVADPAVQATALLLIRAIERLDGVLPEKK
jgi:hypothetical protein